jgi:hypothetical protein
MTYGMKTMTHRTTFALDGTTTSRLKRLASIWQVSQAEVVRRSVLLADQREHSAPDIEARIEAGRRLRESLRGRVSPEEWTQQARDSSR